MAKSAVGLNVAENQAARATTPEKTAKVLAQVAGENQLEPGFPFTVLPFPAVELGIVGIREPFELVDEG